MLSAEVEIPGLVSDCERGVVYLVRGLEKTGYFCHLGLWFSR